MLSFGLRGREGFNFLVGAPRLQAFAGLYAPSPQTLAPSPPSQDPPASQTSPPPQPPTAQPTLLPQVQPVLPDGARSWTVSPGAGIGPISIGSFRPIVEGSIGLPDESRASENWIIGVYRRYGLAVFFTPSNLVDAVAPFPLC